MIHQQKKMAETTTKTPKPSWSAAASMVPVHIEARWVSELEAWFEPLPGWKAPLWRPETRGVMLLRPEGVWSVGVPESANSSFVLRQRGATGWLSARGLRIDMNARPGVWFDQHGIAQRVEQIEQEMMPPPELAGEAQACGMFARWELTDDGRAMGWLDDSFERGPFSVRARGPHLLVSDGSRKVAYWMGVSHWAWPMIERGLFSLRTGRGGGWEPEREYKPVVI